MISLRTNELETAATSTQVLERLIDFQFLTRLLNLTELGNVKFGFRQAIFHKLIAEPEGASEVRS